MADQDGHPVALITGASSGIGEMLAYEIASSGYTVVLTARSETELNRVAGVMTAKLDATAIPIAADISDPASIDELHDELRRRGLISKAYRDSGFINARVRDWTLLNEAATADMNLLPPERLNQPLANSLP